ncbi:hypothetical protein BDY21DRAFT_336554 [Lineolata rhizophorae]|uniref:Uncharacterized protein n=1 Tax=Lineolata rhizophorae TaxID=578093 RepID=A0A6A6P7S8_9PEZI|nr:hypothetical protein BDY21DRAFT_336554 [Lineolata rhizophorae]
MPFLSPPRGPRMIVVGRGLGWPSWVAGTALTTYIHTGAAVPLRPAPPPPHLELAQLTCAGSHGLTNPQHRGHRGPWHHAAIA